MEFGTIQSIFRDKYALLFSFLILVIELTIAGLDQIGDFGNYYFGSMFLLEGNFDLWVYDPGKFNLELVRRGWEGLFLNYTPVPPITALFYLPFTLFNIATAKFFFNLIGAIVLLVSLSRLIKHLKLNAWVLAIIPLLFFQALVSNFQQGQAYLFIAAMMMEGFIAWEKQRFWVSAILWSLPISLKIFPGVVLLFLLQRRDIVQVFRIIIIGALVFSVSLVWISFNVWTEYVVDILPRLMKGEINNPYSTIYQSFSVFLKKLFVYDSLLNPNPAVSVQELYFFLDPIFKLSAIAVFWSICSRMRDAFFGFSIFLFLSFLISGYGSTYGLLFLIPITLFVFQNLSMVKGWIMLLVLFLLINLPVGLFGSLPLIAQFPRLILLLILAGILIYLFPFKISNRKAWIGICILLVLLNFSSKRDQSSLVTYEGNKLLSIEFWATDSGLAVVNFDGELDTTFIPMQIVSQRKISDSEVEDAHDLLLLNHHDLYFLSDRNRGVGFYAVRKLEWE
ncbi:MAG: glycosyltransferase family 87 protein [Flavobacteriales bacterium]